MRVWTINANPLEILKILDENSIEKLNFFIFIIFFENLLVKIEPSEITPFFYNNFFGCRMDFSPFPLATPLRSTALNGHDHLQEKKDFSPNTICCSSKYIESAFIFSFEHQVQGNFFNVITIVNENLMNISKYFYWYSFYAGLGIYSRMNAGAGAKLLTANEIMLTLNGSLIAFLIQLCVQFYTIPRKFYKLS